MSAIKGSYYQPEIIDTDGNIENEGVYGKNTPFVSDDQMGIINLQGANIDYLKTAVDNLGSNITAAQNKLQTSDNDKFKTATVSNATITLTKGTGETTSLTVNNVANANNATNATYSTHARDIYYDLGSFANKTIADLRTAIMNAAIDIGKGNTSYLRFTASFSSIISGWGTTTNVISDYKSGWITVRISNIAITGGNYFHGTIYTYDVPEYTFSVLNGVWSELNRNLVQSDYDTLNSAITTTNTNINTLTTNDKAKFKSVSVSNDTLTFTNGSGTTTSVTVNNVANATNATNATNASYTTTQAATDNSTKIASTAFVQTAVANLVSSAPETLNTLNELATALGNDPNFATTVSNKIGTVDAKANTNASNISSLATSIATNFTDISVNNDTITLRQNNNETKSIKVNNVQYAIGATQINTKYIGAYRNNEPLSVVRDAFNSELADMTKKGCSVRFIRLNANLTTIYNNWAKNWDAPMMPWGTVYGVISLLGDDDNYANVELVGWTGTTVLLQRIAGNWKTAENKVRTINGLNRADTWGLRGIDFTFDFMGSSTDQVVLGGNTVNYLGNGFKYLFKDGKGSYADIYADEYYGTFRGKAMVGGISSTVDLNKPYTDTYSKKLEVTDSATANNLPYKYNFITTLKSNTDIAQLAIPASTNARISLRCMPNQSNNTLNGDWLEIPYLRDIQPIAAAEVAKLVNSAPATLDTLSELANALGNDPNFATTVSTQIGKKANKTDVDSQIQDVNTKLSQAFGSLHVPTISILKGICGDGETIPLPDGYTDSQCTIFVSMANANPNNYWFDVNENGAKNMIRFECYTEGRILRCAMLFLGFDGWKTGPNGSQVPGPRIACLANYMVIGIKYGG